MGASGVSSPLRILNLALNLIHTPGGLSLEAATRIVPGYLPANPDSARRMFERDIAQLRESGLVVDVSDSVTPTYSISTSALSDTAVNLSGQEISLLLRAADMWGISRPAYAALRHKLAGHAWGPLPETPSTDMHLRESDAVAILVNAIGRRHLVEFEYAAKRGTSTRSVAPWRLVANGSSLYLWGFDMDRWDGRLFRLSRFVSLPTLIGTDGDGDPSGPLKEQPFDDSAFVVAPLLLVKEGAAPASETFSVEVPTPSGDAVVLPDTWRLRLGVEDDAGIWEDRILTEALGVSVVEPKWLKESIGRRLAAAAEWGAVHDG